METTIAASGIRRDQFIALGAIGGLFFGCMSTMAECAECLVRNQHAFQAIIPIVCFAISNCILVALWKNRDRMRLRLAMLATILPVILWAISLWNFIAVKDSHDTLKTLPWPTSSFLTTFVTIVPITIFFTFLTNSYFKTRSLRAEETRRSQAGAT